MDSSSSRPPQNAFWVISTTLSQLEASVCVFYLLSSVPYLPILSGPGIVLPSVGFLFLSAASSFSFFLAATSHPFTVCLAHIPEGPPEQ